MPEILEQVKTALKPRFVFSKAGNMSKKPFSARAVKGYRLPKLIQIGNSLGVVIGHKLLSSIDWRKGDCIQYEYDDKEKVLTLRNFTAEGRENAIHKAY
jgi:hypothetical protein